ncbi:MAG: LamG-like jellyroll fold domain-containing protein [Kiritimatiellia bacterium]
MNHPAHPRPPLSRWWLAAALAAVPVGAAPPAYEKRATWQDTLAAGMEAARAPGTPAPARRMPDLGGDDFTVMAGIRTKGDATIPARTPAGKAAWAPGARALFVRGGRLNYDIGWAGCVTSRLRVDDGAWHHVAVTGPDPVRLYVDGREDAEGDLGAGPGEPGFVTRIGFAAPNFPETSAFRGAIDEVRIHARRLDAAEISGLGGKPVAGAPPEAAPAAHWAFEESVADLPDGGLRTEMKGGEATYGEGRIGRALLLDGRAYAETAPTTAATPDPWAFTLPPGWWERLRADFPELKADFDQVVFVRRLTYNANHYYTEFINSSWMPGGNLCVLDLRDGSVREIVPQLRGGVFERFDLSFDARRIVFAWKAGPQEGYRIYEVNVDGGGLRQLTFPEPDEAGLVAKYRVDPGYHHGTDDMQPCYLPDGGIVFISTRCRHGVLCDPPDNFTTTVLYRMDADGGNLRKLSNSALSEASPAVTEDGRILYTRWEYVDKGAVSVKCLWVMRPDGSASSEVYKNDIALPPTFLHGRPIPGAANEFVVLGTPHYPQNGVGTVIRIDTTRDLRTRDPMTYMTPGVDIQAEPGFAFRAGNGPWRQDGHGRGPLFKDPYPLARDRFLVAHKPAGPVWSDPRAYGLCLLDDTGRVFPLYKDPEFSCWLPYPLRPRRVPPVLPSSPDPGLAAKNQAVCVLADVYRGMTGVPRGTIRHLRILEQVPRPWAVRQEGGGDEYDQQYKVITKDTHLGLKVQHGVVPVEEDGSAHFVVPSGANIFLQALDENYFAVQTERTYVNYMPGEQRSCVGCHESPAGGVPANTGAGGMLKALARPPSVPGPQPGESRGARVLDYVTDVQPVWDRHCVSCHAGGKDHPPPDLRGELTERFNLSYESLVPERRRGFRDPGLLGPVIGENHPKTGNVEYLPPRTLGSHASVLVALFSGGTIRLSDPAQAERVRKLAGSHQAVHLAREELIRVANWVDTNAQYYGSYWGRRNLKYNKHKDFRPVLSIEEARRPTPPLDVKVGGADKSP